MRFLLAAIAAFFLTLLTQLPFADADTFSKRFEKGSQDFGAQVGWGHTFDPVSYTHLTLPTKA